MRKQMQKNQKTPVPLGSRPIPPCSMIAELLVCSAPCWVSQSLVKSDVPPSWLQTKSLGGYNCDEEEGVKVRQRCVGSQRLHYRRALGTRNGMEQLVVGRRRRQKTLDSSVRMHFMHNDLASHFFVACPTVPLGAVTVNYLICCGKILSRPHVIALVSRP